MWCCSPKQKQLISIIIYNHLLSSPRKIPPSFTVSFFSNFFLFWSLKKVIYLQLLSSFSFGFSFKLSLSVSFFFFFSLEMHSWISQQYWFMGEREEIQRSTIACGSFANLDANCIWYASRFFAHNSCVLLYFGLISVYVWFMRKWKKMIDGSCIGLGQ